MLKRLGRFATRIVARAPWTNGYGAARSLIALSTALTLAVNPAYVLFAPRVNHAFGPVCDGAARFGLFCVAGEHWFVVARVLSIALLTLVVAGVRPSLTALPHAWVAYSVQANISVLDGGDQVAWILSALLVPIALSDRRRNHWSPPLKQPTRHFAATLSYSAWYVIRLQVAVVYFQASVGKMVVREWYDGTAVYYWFHDPWFGMPNWLGHVLTPILQNGPFVTLLTWGVIALEFVLCTALVMAPRFWRPLLYMGFALHIGIAVVHGLISFALVMFGALLLYLRPIGKPVWNGYTPAGLLRRMKRPVFARGATGAVSGL
jgi:antimicrobial peptide system SdpB family protein